MEEEDERSRRGDAISSDSSDLPQHADLRRSPPRAIAAAKEEASDSDLSNYSFDLTQDEIAALKKQYERMERENKFDEEMMFKDLVKEEIQDNKMR